MSDTRLPPQDPLIERSVIASCMLAPGAYMVAADLLVEEDFYSPTFRKAWKIMRTIAGPDGWVDQYRLLPLLSDSEQVIVIDALDDAATYVNPEPYCQRLREMTAFRALIAASQKIQAMAYDHADRRSEEIVAEAQGLIRAVESREAVKHYRHAEVIVREALEDIERMKQGKAGGIQTGLATLDDLLGGIYPGELVIVGGRPGMGKTALAVQISGHLAKQGHNVLLCELEMTDKELMLRELCAAAGVSLHSIRAGRMTNADYYRLAEASGVIASLPLFIDDKPKQTPEHIYSRARRLKHERGSLSLIVIDNFQLLRSQHRIRDRYERNSEISNDLKSLPKEIGCPVMLVSHLGRDVEKRTNKRPVQSDLKETGSLEQDADIILFPYRPERYSDKPEHVGVVEMIVAKHRNGPEATVDLRWNSKLMRFTDVPNF